MGSAGSWTEGPSSRSHQRAAAPFGSWTGSHAWTSNPFSPGADDWPAPTRSWTRGRFVASNPSSPRLTEPAGPFRHPTLHCSGALATLRVHLRRETSVTAKNPFIEVPATLTYSYLPQSLDHNRDQHHQRRCRSSSVGRALHSSLLPLLAHWTLAKWLPV